MQMGGSVREWVALCSNECGKMSTTASINKVLDFWKLPP